MNKEKEIEEMAQVAMETLEPKRREAGDCPYHPCRYSKNHIVFCDVCLTIEALYKAGYRKVAEQTDEN